MPKQLVRLNDEQRAALIPNGIEGFIPRCVVCGEPVPLKRARGRSKDTCGAECHAVLREYRAWVIRSSRCPACYHPSTPEERADFVAWRKARGDRKAGRGRPRKEDPIIAASAAIVLAALAMFDGPECRSDFEEMKGSTSMDLPVRWMELMCACEDYQKVAPEKVIDSSNSEQGTLPPSGQ
jgi:hypothetical protein